MKHDARGTMDDKMWIKRMPDDYFNHPSFCCDDVMLWQNGKIYVMDNHRDATWCWFHQCRDGERYNFMHIDRHYDMGDYYYDEDLEPIKANPRMEYEAYANLKRVDDFLTLRWDNYIRLAYELRPEWFQTNIFLTQKGGDICEGWHKNRMNISEKDSLFLLAHMNQYLLEMSECLYDVAPDSHELKWIVNLDLDMFFYHDGGDVRLQLFSDDYIREVGKLLQNAMDNIQVLTIAISPDCLAGKDMKSKWDNGFRVLELLSEHLYGLWEFPFPR